MPCRWPGHNREPEAILAPLRAVLPRLRPPVRGLGPFSRSREASKSPFSSATLSKDPVATIRPALAGCFRTSERDTMAHETPGQGRGHNKTTAEISALAWRAARLPRRPAGARPSPPARPAGPRAMVASHAPCARTGRLPVSIFLPDCSLPLSAAAKVKPPPTSASSTPSATIASISSAARGTRDNAGFSRVLAFSRLHRRRRRAIRQPRPSVLSYDPAGRSAASGGQSHEPGTRQLTDHADIPVASSKERDS